MKKLISQFISQHLLGVVSTVNKDNTPEAALVGIAVSEDLEIIFDTVTSSRKYHNILQNPQVALVIGWDIEVTVQYEGKATVLGDNAESKSLKEIYFKVYPDGHVRVKTMPGLVLHLLVLERLFFSFHLNYVKGNYLRFDTVYFTPSCVNFYLKSHVSYLKSTANPLPQHPYALWYQKRKRYLQQLH